jgi:isoleucyl-tRNA synthetase
MSDAAQGEYARYEFHLVVQRLQTYCSEDLGGFYLDVLKDRLYTTGKASRARRSAQTALALIRDALLELMAPVLSFTAEEAWRIVHPDDATIFCRTWTGGLPALPDADRLVAKWARILAVRSAAQKELERLRQDGRIGSSLQAEVAIGAAGDDYDALASLHDDLRFVLITSAATVNRGETLAIKVTPSAHAKCERCWHYRADVGSDATHVTLCGRCVSNMAGPGEARAFA